MIEISLLSGELLFAALWLLCRGILWLRQKKIVWKREAVLLLMFVNLAVLIRFVFYNSDQFDPICEYSRL